MPSTCNGASPYVDGFDAGYRRGGEARPDCPASPSSPVDPPSKPDPLMGFTLRLLELERRVLAKLAAVDARLVALERPASRSLPSHGQARTGGVA